MRERNGRSRDNATALGLALGLLFGTIFDNIPLGMLGGLAFGFFLSAKEK